MRKIVTLIFCLAITAIMTNPKLSLADDSFEYHGYARSGTAVNGTGHRAGNDGQFFQAPGANTKYRLGNEAGNTYVENTLQKNWKNEDGSYFKWVMLGAVGSSERGNFERGTHRENEGHFVLRQSYAEGGNFKWAPGVSYWAGQKYYGRDDVYISDFYFRDLSGFGGGISGISLGSSKLAVALITSSDYGYNASNIRSRTLLRDDDAILGEAVQYNLDIRLSEISMPGGKLEIELCPIYVNGGDVVDYSGNAGADDLAYTDPNDNLTYQSADLSNDVTQEIKSHFGGHIDLVYGLDSFFGMKGYAKIVLQYAHGMSGFGAGSGGLSAITTGTLADDASDPTKQNVMRGLVFGLAELSENTSLMPLFVYQRSDNGAKDAQINTWYSTGFRLKQMINENFALQLEYGFDYTDRKDDANSNNDLKGGLHKITFAPTIQPVSGFWAKPEIRAYATYAKWSSDFKGQVGSDSDRSDEKTSAMRFGLQAEAWW